MKKCFVVLTLLASGLLLPGRTEAHCPAEDLPKMIQTASSVLFDSSASAEQIRDALVRLLDAALLTLPQSAQAADARKNLEAARTEMKNSSPLSDKVYGHLDQAYRALNAGKSFQFPDVHSIGEAKAHIKDLLAASVAGLKKGPEGPTSGLLLESVIMVVTPMPR
jgi:hypothetical protein